MKCRETGISFFFLIRETSGGENNLGKLFSSFEIPRNPSKYLPYACCYSLFFIISFIIKYSMISAYWVVLVYSLQCLSTVTILLPGYEKRNLLNGGISFSVRKSYFIWPRQSTSTKKFRFPYVNKFVGINVLPGIFRVHSVCLQSR